ncbi:bifunctional diguanylate cyclase/phosphodiesterase [Hespellia stercorisuis]|uniref:Diguanylate cyclase (GGDEF) domain-containing protein n=1 Tax=Hespellia stercorisuis DSM 15480 TaxID=1121950 RepID=A0A1M6J129_9FIRM|nr:bifunctional diguanylate cyclase/phosphodiesterase [Hespellia stercorisuis]SHJ40375.1 diguanylate cyclase (GGDEF) domain-containing protein [Hespellia stercorisuis DSM 15480]
MKERYKQQTIIENMNVILCAIVEHYNADYSYYIEREDGELPTVYEWCKTGMPFQKEYLRGLSEREFPEWVLRETDDYDISIHKEVRSGVIGILAVVNVQQNWHDSSLLRMVLPYVSQSITMQKQQMQQEYLSYHDDLTGLLNRNSMLNYLETTDAESLESVGALCVDINGLKFFNKEFGREYGDEVVMRVGELLEEHFKGDMVYRLTGDEFLVISENISYDNFIKQMNAANDRLENISLDLTTMGYAWEKVDIELNNLINTAEEMMREEKQKFYKKDKTDHTPIIKDDLLEDIAQGNFIVCLQPKMHVDTEAVSSAEALVRYRHKDLGIMDPQRYLNLLERTRLSHHLDMYVFETVCRIIEHWIQKDMPVIPISVNISSDTLCREDTVEQMMRLVEKYKVPCEYLEIEVSENDDCMNQEVLAETSNRIRKANIRVVLDNFGTKNSSLSILSIMEFDGLKVDRTLVTNIVSNHRSQIVARAIISICKELGATVVATGVETQDQLNVLKELGCDYAQGFLFNKPVALDTFEVRYMQE